MGRRPLLVRGLSVLCAVLISTSSWAATTVTVNPSKGSVLVNRGNGYTEIKRPTKVHAGNSVMVGPDGAAIIAYADGCSVKFVPREINRAKSKASIFGEQSSFGFGLSPFCNRGVF